MRSMAPMGGLEATLRQRLARRESQGRLRHLEVPRSDLVDFSSNDYLSLSRDFVVRDALAAYLRRPDRKSPSIGSNGRLIGSGGSRLLDGNSVFVEQLERKIADFHASEAALLFNSAYDANVGLISSVPGAGDVILYDNLIHASIHDGMRLSRATRKIPFRHNSVIRHVRERTAEPGAVGVDGPDDLVPTLKQLIRGDQRVRSGSANVFICIEALYSMDGDIVDLQYVSNIIDSLFPKGNCYIIVDEAHSIGVLGDGGRGLVCQLGLEDRVFARVVGFGKAMGCAGGAILCSSVVRHYLINYARTLIYTTAMSFPSLASIDAAYDYLISGKAEARRRQLKILIQHCHVKLKDINERLRPSTSALRVPEGQLNSPIIPLFTRYPRDLARHCQTSGFMIRPIVAPTVPHGQDRIRICLHGTNTIEQIDALSRAIEAWLRHLEMTQNAETKIKSQAGDATGQQIQAVLPESAKPRL
ncbi:PLP-dependent transferase [Nemania sp. NC0429]|nr:PLP-dependent transferase [Nemania sp. NC0429]